MDKDVATLQAEAEAKKQVADAALEDARKATLAAQDAVRLADQEARKARWAAEQKARVVSELPLRKKLYDVCVSTCKALSTEDATVVMQTATLDGTELFWARIVGPDNQARVRIELSPGDTFRHRGSPMAVNILVGIDNRKRFPMRKDGSFSWDKIGASIKELYEGQVVRAKREKDGKESTLNWLSTMEAMLGANGAKDIRRTEGYTSGRSHMDTEVVGKFAGATVRITRKWGSAILSAEYEVGHMEDVEQMKRLLPILSALPVMKKEERGEPVSDNAS